MTCLVLILSLDWERKNNLKTFASYVPYLIGNKTGTINTNFRFKLGKDLLKGL